MEAIIAKEGPLALRAGWLEDASDFMKTWREDIIIGVDDSTRMVLDHTMPNTYLMSHPDSVGKKSRLFVRSSARSYCIYVVHSC